MPRAVAALLVPLTVACAAPAADDLESGTSSPTPTRTVASRPPPGVKARVTRVVDGDTFEARVGRKILDVRMIGIDAPESVAPTEPIECFGLEASAFAERSLDNAPVLLEWDVQRIDPFGRTLAYVWMEGRLFNEEIVNKGYATVATFPPNVAHVTRLVEAERRARRDGLGLWGACLEATDTGAEWRESDEGG